MAGFRCVGGVCSAGGCDSDDDCPAGQQCLDGRCEDGDSCTSDVDCPIGESCVDGRCQPAGCTSDMDCPVGESCVSGQCQPAGCTSDADCPSGRHCLDGDCYAQECLNDSHCAPGASCTNGSCITATTCDPMTQSCPAGQRCALYSSAWMCGPAGDGSQCFYSALDDCPAGMMCATADGATYDCCDLCVYVSGAGCPYGLYNCYGVDGFGEYGLCVGDCHPVRQDCWAGEKCTLDEFGSPLCYWNAGSGAGCRAGSTDDCPAGMMCAYDGQSNECYPFCLVRNGIGCIQGETCVGLDYVAHWGVCVSGRSEP